MRINNYNSLYRNGQKLEPFIASPLCFAYEQIPLGIKGIYVFFDFNTGELLYIGKSKDLRKRLYSYAELGYGSAYEKINKILEKHNDIEVLAFKSDDNYLLEDDLIKQYKPPYNKRTEL
jgi:excinuclease UvrABC nuclease subunit